MQEEHSRFNEEHYRNCQPCYEDHLDFMQDHPAKCSDCYEAALDFAMEQEDDARLDAMAEASESEDQE
jgi:protein-arginine kinase activator protein McsA